MDHHNHNHNQQGSDHQSSPSPKVERRIIERNRRNQMKDLYSKLYSLLPNYNSKEMLPLLDQVDEAINYIKSLETKVKMAKEKKESLLKRSNKRSRGCSSSAFETQGSLKSPKLEVHETGSSLEVVLTCGLGSQFLFNEIIRILNEESIEVTNANSSMVGDTMINVAHAEIRPSFYEFGATKVSERLRRFVNGSVSDVEIEAGLWDFEIDTETWELPDLSVTEGFPNLL